MKYELSFYLGSIVKDGNGVTVVTTINYHVEPNIYVVELTTHKPHIAVRIYLYLELSERKSIV